MELAKLIQNESPTSLRFILIMASISGAANAALVALINMGASAVHNSERATQELFMFLVCLALFTYTKREAETHGKQIIESSMTRLRLRFYKKIMNAQVSYIESSRRTTLVAQLSRNIGQVIQASDNIVFGFQAMVMLVFCLIYLVVISPLAFFVIFCGALAVGVMRNMRNDEGAVSQSELIRREGLATNYVDSMLKGFKELKIDRSKQSSIYGAYSDLVEETRTKSIATTNRYVRMRILMQGVFFLVLAVVVFVIPALTTTYSKEVLEITAVALFISAYMTALVEIIPVVIRTNAALKSMQGMETELDEHQDDSLPLDSELRARFSEFSSLSGTGIKFTYQSGAGREETFTAGPLDLTIERQTTTFLVGGNGSGKSTLAKLLIGLYQPDAGFLKLDDVEINRENVRSYRDLFSIVLTDFHLFDRFYGYEDADPEWVAQWIDKMGLKGKVRFEDGAFTTLELSTGQRKRLALIVTLLEDREIMVFDEWAAEQDVHFREYFYEEFLPWLRDEKGKTIIAVTHDRSYWKTADNVLTMDYGQIVERD